MVVKTSWRGLPLKILKVFLGERYHKGNREESKVMRETGVCGNILAKEKSTLSELRKNRRFSQNYTPVFLKERRSRL